FHVTGVQTCALPISGSLLLGGCCQSRTVHAELAGARCTAGSRRHKLTSARCSLAFRWHRPACGKNCSVPTANPSTLCRQCTHVARRRQDEAERQPNIRGASRAGRGWSFYTLLVTIRG